MRPLTIEERRTAEDAARVLASPVFRAAFDAIDTELTDAMKHGATLEVREGAWSEYQALCRVKGKLFHVLENAAYREEKAGPLKRLLEKVNIIHRRGSHE